MNELTNFLNGYVSFAKRQFDDSLMYFQTVLETDRENTESLYNVGLCFVYLGDYDQAINYYDKALEIDPNDDFIAEARYIAKQQKYLYRWVTGSNRFI